MVTIAHLTPDRVVQVEALPGVIVLCSWTRYVTLTLPLSTESKIMGIKWRQS